MVPRLQNAEYRGGFTVHVAFLDGAEGEIDLEPELWGEMFEPLRDVEQFRQFRLDQELNTLVWPNGADLAPEFLHDRVAGTARHGAAGNHGTGIGTGASPL